jgi:hypothetical protein
MPIAKSVKFNFKSRKITNEEGKEIGRTKKQPSITTDLPVLAVDEIVAKLQANGEPNSVEEKVKSLISEAVAQIIVDAARDQFDEIIEAFGDDQEKEVAASMLDFDKLSLEFISTIPPSARGAAALTEEDFELFFTDYMAVMVTATGKTEDKIKNHINLFKKPTKAKANKEVLAVLIDQLDVYMASSQNLEDTGLVATRIRNKFDKWVKEPEKQIDLSVL